MEFVFPQYRKLEGFGRYYKIHDERNFEEVSVMNETIHRSFVEAKQYPEILRIQDMLSESWSFRTMSDEEIQTYFQE